MPTKKKVIKKSALSPTALIIGGAGFIGSHLAEALLLKDVRVVVIDNFSTGKDIFVQPLLKNAKFALFDFNINTGLPEEIQSVDYVFDLAGLEIYLFDKQDAGLNSLLTNGVGAKVVLDFCKASGAKLLIASTTDVYKGMISPTDLTYYYGKSPRDEKRFTIAEAKRYAEALAWEYYKNYALDVRVARFPEVYGPRMSLQSSGTLGELIKNTLDNKDLEIRGDGTEKEFYLYIDDAISGLIKAMFSQTTKGKIYSFVNDEPYNTLEATYLIKNMANTELQVVYTPKAKALLRDTFVVPDTTSLADLAWRPAVSFKEGLIKTFNWFGYEINQHAFKPNKFIENKKAETAKHLLTLTDNQTSTLSEPETNIVLPIAPADVVAKTLWRQKLGAGFRGWHNRHKRVPAEKPLPNLSSEVKYMSSQPAGLKNRSKLSKALWLLFIPVFIVGVYLSATLARVYSGAKAGKHQLELTKTNLQTFNVAEAAQSSNEAYKNFYASEEALKKVKWGFNIIGRSHQYDAYVGLLDGAKSISEASVFFTKGLLVYESLAKGLKPDAPNLNPVTLAEAKSLFIAAYDKTKSAFLYFSGVEDPYLSTYLNSTTELFDFAEKTKTLALLTADLPTLLGFDGKKSYLLLFQNSNELRPTGGFIGSYGVLTLESGKVSDIFIDDIYNPDGQLDLQKAKNPAPAPIKQYLTETDLRLRNANWDPDFSVSAKTISDMFFLVNQKTYDGVIAVDLYLLKSVLDAVGPVYLAAYNEEITGANVYEKTQYHSEFAYIAGSPQKRNFLTLLGGKLLEKLFSADATQTVKLVSALEQAYVQKHFLLAFPPVYSKLNVYKMQNGTLAQTKEDYLYVVNANLGGTKANYYVKNKMAYTVASKTRDGLLRAELKLTYTHTQKDNAWPGGPYTNYLRVLTQAGAKLTGAKITFDGTQTEDIFKQIEIGTEGGYTKFAYGFKLDPQETVDLILDYDLPQNLSISKENKLYSLYWQKQPGTQDDEVSFLFTAPFGVSVIEQKAPGVMALTLGNGSAHFASVLTTDIRVLFGLK